MNKKILAILLTSIISVNISNVTASGNTATSALKYAVYAGVAISGCVALKELYTYTQNLNASLDTTDVENTESTEEGYTEPGATGEENTDEDNAGPGATDGEGTEEDGVDSDNDSNMEEFYSADSGDSGDPEIKAIFRNNDSQPEPGSYVWKITKTGSGALAAVVTIGVIVHVVKRNGTKLMRSD